MSGVRPSAFQVFSSIITHVPPCNGGHKCTYLLAAPTWRSARAAGGKFMVLVFNQIYYEDEFSWSDAAAARIFSGARDSSMHWTHHV